LDQPIEMAIPKMMKAAVVTKCGTELTMKEVPVPEVGADEILVKVAVSGVCHTDVHVADGDFGDTTGIIPGHEGCGHVVAMGANVKSLKIGDRVGIPWLHEACLSCFDCNDGWETVCVKQKQTGFTTNGGFAEFVKAKAAFVGRIPDSVSFEQAAPITCAGVTVYKALKEANVKPGQWVVILGAAGGLGHVGCQYAKAMGMKVIAVSRSMSEAKSSMFKKYGVDYPLDMSKESVKEGVMKATEGVGAQGVICLSPSTQDIGDAVEYIRPRGTIVPVGLPPDNFSASVIQTVLKAVNFKGSIVGTRNDLAEAFEFAASGMVTCDVAVRKFDEVNDIMKELRHGKIVGRVVLRME